MSRKGKIILAVSLSVVALGTGILGYGAWSIYSFLNSIGELTDADIPAELSEPRVLKGNDILAKREIFKKVALSQGDMILKAANIADEEEREIFTESEVAKRFYGFSDVARCGDEIVAVGKFGGYRLDLEGNLKDTLSFEPLRDDIKILFWKQKHVSQTLDNLRVVDVESDGRCEFVSNGSTDGFTYFDATGKVVWRYGNRKLDEVLANDSDDYPWITGVDVGDVDDDGILDFLISKKADGIRAFTADKREIWFQPDEFPTSDLLFVDTDADGARELVEFHGGSSTVRDKRTGKILHPLKLDGGADGIIEVVGEKKKGEAQVYEIAGNKLTVKDLSGAVVYSSEAPLSQVTKTPKNERAANSEYEDDTDSVYEPRAQMVLLNSGKPKYLVILASYIGMPRTNLYVYGPGGQLVFHELLDEDAETLSVIRNPDGTEGFLVGGKDSIWKYTAK